MQVNRNFHYRLVGLEFATCGEDESFNLEAAGRSFVPQCAHIIQSAPVDKSTHTHTLHMCMHINIFTFHLKNFSNIGPSVDQGNSVDLCFARQVSSVSLLCSL